MALFGNDPRDRIHDRRARQARDTQQTSDLEHEAKKGNVSSIDELRERREEAKRRKRGTPGKSTGPDLDAINEAKPKWQQKKAPGRLKMPFAGKVGKRGLELLGGGAKGPMAAGMGVLSLAMVDRAGHEGMRNIVKAASSRANPRLLEALVGLGVGGGAGTAKYMHERRGMKGSGKDPNLAGHLLGYGATGALAALGLSPMLQMLRARGWASGQAKAIRGSHADKLDKGVWKAISAKGKAGSVDEVKRLQIARSALFDRSRVRERVIEGDIRELIQKARKLNPGMYGPLTPAQFIADERQSVRAAVIGRMKGAQLRGKPAKAHMSIAERNRLRRAAAVQYKLNKFNKAESGVAARRLQLGQVQADASPDLDRMHQEMIQHQLGITTKEPTSALMKFYLTGDDPVNAEVARSIISEGRKRYGGFFGRRS